MQPADKNWNLSSSLPLATLVLALAAGSWGVFGALVTLVSQTFGFTSTQFSFILLAPAAIGIPLLWPFYRWAVHAARPGTVLLLAFLALIPALAGLALATQFSHLLLVGAGLGVVPGCFATGVVYLHRLTRLPCPALTAGLLVLCALGVAFAYASTPLITDAFGWRFTPLMSIGLIVIAAGLLATLGESTETRV
ncbi:NarK/NasA family nitrate transporter [Halospina sp. K52047b]|uniref:NarK/NasA family nitrate transporter n=1 Tax=Halospina sp. K52047b TaxID=2614160 RepID=UPI00124A599B|nr:NarK/NasA family nitrate transporter [Halospina sp. K52047b]KAA8981320.1 NarK/NasA family nitrate transporter [Halospina sp. K52047b]